MKRWTKPGLFPINVIDRRYRKWIRALIIELDAQEGIAEMQAMLLVTYKRITGIETFKELHAKWRKAKETPCSQD